MSEKLLLRVNEAADLLGVSYVTVYRLIWTGQLRPVHIGRAVRIPREEVERFVREVREDGGAVPTR